MSKVKPLLHKLLILRRNKKFIIISAIGIFILILTTILIFKLFDRQKSPNKPHPGILAINTNKSQYLLKEKMLVGMVSFDNTGRTLCNSNLKLEITGPEKQTKTLNIANSPTCGEKIVTNDPDYSSSYDLEKTGQYKLRLTNLDNKTNIETEIKVLDKLTFNVSRSGATRINPSESNRYPMIITVKSDTDYQGQIKETIPEGFNIVWQGPAKIEGQNLIWDVNLKAGEVTTLSYEYIVPEVSSQLYKLGPVRLADARSGQAIFEESRQWQIMTAK